MHTQILLYNTNISECDFAFLANMKAALLKRLLSQFGEQLRAE